MNYSGGDKCELLRSVPHSLGYWIFLVVHEKNYWNWQRTMTDTIEPDVSSQIYIRIKRKLHTVAKFKFTQFRPVLPFLFYVSRFFLLVQLQYSFDEIPFTLLLFCFKRIEFVEEAEERRIKKRRKRLNGTLILACMTEALSGSCDFVFYLSDDWTSMQRSKERVRRGEMRVCVPLIYSELCALVSGFSNIVKTRA